MFNIILLALFLLILTMIYGLLVFIGEYLAFDLGQSLMFNSLSMNALLLMGITSIILFIVIKKQLNQRS